MDGAMSDQIVCSICWEQGITSPILTVPIDPKRTAGGDYIAAVLGARPMKAEYEYRCEQGHVCGFIMDGGQLHIGIIPPAVPTVICAACNLPILDDYDERHWGEMDDEFSDIEYHAGCCPECNPEGTT